MIWSFSKRFWAAKRRGLNGIKSEYEKEISGLKN
jgi:hypothetical protein